MIVGKGDGLLSKAAEQYAIVGKRVAFVIVVDVDTGEAEVGFFGPQSFRRSEVLAEIARDFGAEESAGGGEHVCGGVS